MPKFEVNQYGENQDLVFKPADGDIRYRDYGALERWQSGSWAYMGDIMDLFDSLPGLKMDRDRFQIWIDAKDAQEMVADELEGEFDDLAKAGEHLRQLEAMLKVARKTYDSLTDDVKDRLKTFERLDTPYPDDEEGPGYSI